jgi:biuret amidohydrolase
MTTIDANPYPWPWDNNLSVDRLAVVVAGAQQYWWERTLGADAALEVLTRLVHAARASGAVVVWTRHGRSEAVRNSLPVRGSESWALVGPVEVPDLVIDAAGHDGCFASSLDAELRVRGRDCIVMCGLGLEGPVHSTLRALNDRGYECLTVTDACAAYETASASAAISTITMSFGIFGVVAPSTAVLAALAQEVLCQ